jgi:hypothetical protein
MDDLVKRLQAEAECYRGTTQACLLEAKALIEAQAAALEKISKAGKKALIATWDSEPEHIRQDAAHLWACLAICVDGAEDALGENKDDAAT